MPWEQVHLWWGDDRFVPADHPLSNVHVATSDLLEIGATSGESGTGASGVDVTGGRTAGAPIHAANVHPMPIGAAIGEAEGPDWAAQRYAGELVAAGAEFNDGVPAFDLVLIGMGPDGHVLSVFPGSAAFDAREPVLGVPAPTHVEPHVARVTLHPRILEVARSVIVVAHGAAKADVLADVLGAERDERRWPAQLARRAGATWILDEAAPARIRYSGTRDDAPRHVVSRDGTPIAVFSSGEGPPVILVHGATADHTTWRATGPHPRGGDYRIHAIDRRGRGDSGDGDGPYGSSWSTRTSPPSPTRVADEAGEPGRRRRPLVRRPDCALGAALLTASIGRIVVVRGRTERTLGWRRLPASPASKRRIAELIEAGDRDAALETFFREIVRMPPDELAAYRRDPDLAAAGRGRAHGRSRSSRREASPAASLDALGGVSSSRCCRSSAATAQPIFREAPRPSTRASRTGGWSSSPAPGTPPTTPTSSRSSPRSGPSWTTPT